MSSVNIQPPPGGDLRRRWFRFAIGLVSLGLCVAFFASGYTLPGVCGEVLRHNQECDIDASPLLYSEVENMQELEEGLRELRAGARDSADSGTGIK